MRETGEEIEELTNEIRHDIEVNLSLHTTVFACYFSKSSLTIYIPSLYYIFNTSMYMYKHVYVESFRPADFYCY